MTQKNRLLFVAFMGPVGTGKTYAAKILAGRLKAVHVRADDIRVRLRNHGKPFSSAPKIAFREIKSTLDKGKSVISDSDATNPKMQKEFRRYARETGTKLVLIKIKTPEKLVLFRLRRKKYTKKEIFQSAEEAITAYFSRKKFYEKLRVRGLRSRPDFVIFNDRPLARQITRVVKKLR